MSWKAKGITAYAETDIEHFLYSKGETHVFISSLNSIAEVIRKLCKVCVWKDFPVILSGLGVFLSYVNANFACLFEMNGFFSIIK